MFRNPCYQLLCHTVARFDRGESMKALKRNKRTFYYALYEGKDQVIDEYGNFTGEYENHWGKPCSYAANISSAKGETDTRQFGENETYDKVLVMDNDEVGLQIDEYTVLWIDTLPTLDENGETTIPYDYIVKKVARSINNVAFAITKVEVQ